MSALRDAVAAAFARGGPLALADPQHVEREVQLRMALGVAEAVNFPAAVKTIAAGFPPIA